jgi:hypothetical protein
MYKFVVRWEKYGKTHRKEYDDEATAKKAKAWVIERGGENVDIAVLVVPVANHFPTKKGGQDGKG